MKLGQKKQTVAIRKRSIFWNLDVSIGNLLLQILGILTVDRAADRHAGAENLLHCAGQVLGHGPRAHDPGDLDNIVQRNVAIVLDVLGLLAVALGLFEGFDDQSGGRGDDGDLGLAILDGEFDSDTEALPVLGGLFGDVFSDFLRGETERADFGGE